MLRFVKTVFFEQDFYVFQAGKIDRLYGQTSRRIEDFVVDKDFVFVLIIS